MAIYTEQFEAWWSCFGRSYDPDTDDVSWFDKRKGLACAAFDAAMAQSGNYVADTACEPSELRFANGRRVWIRFDEDDNPFLATDRPTP